MNAKQFFDLVVIMRREQRAYSRSNGRDRKALQNAKDCERRVDEEIKRVQMLAREEQFPRLEL